MNAKTRHALGVAGTVASISISLFSAAAIAAMLVSHPARAVAATTTAHPAAAQQRPAAPAVQVPPTPSPVWPASWPGQVGDTCLATSTNMLLNAYGVHSDLATYEHQLYVPGWNTGPNDQLADTYLKAVNLQLTASGDPTVAEIAASGPALLTVRTADLPWWSVSSVQGEHEVVLTGHDGAYVQVWDPAFGAYKLIAPGQLAAATDEIDAVTPLLQGASK